MGKGLMQAATTNRRLSALIVAETALITGAAALVAQGHLGTTPVPLAQILPGALVLAAVCQLCLYYGDLYDNPQASSHTELLVRILQALGATLIILSLVYIWFPSLTLGTGVIPAAAGLAGAAVIAARMTFDWLTRSVGPRERLLVVGTSSTVLSLARELAGRRELGIELVGYVDVQNSGSDENDPLKFLGTIEDIPPIVRARAVDRVVVSLADARGKLPMDKLLEMKLNGVRFDHLTSVYEEYTGKIAVENLRPSWLIFSPGFRKTRLLLAAKRLVDVCGA